MEFDCLVEQAGVSSPFEKMLHGMDAEGKWDAQKAVVGLQWSVVSFAVSVIKTPVNPPQRLEDGTGNSTEN